MNLQLLLVLHAKKKLESCRSREANTTLLLLEKGPEMRQEKALFSLDALM